MVLHIVEGQNDNQGYRPTLPLLGDCPVRVALAAKCRTQQFSLCLDFQTNIVT